jgi:2-dehydropantoate 2-reductase
VQRVRDAGLYVDGVRGQFRVAPTASEDPAILSDCDLVLVSVKLPDTVPAIEAARKHLSPECLLVSLQNGIRGPRLLGEAVGIERVIGGVVMLGASYVTPGAITFSSDGFLAIGMAAGGRPRALISVAELLEAALPVEVVDDIGAALWAKVVINTDMPILALTGRRYPEGLLDPAIHNLMLDAAQEGLDILDMTSIGRPTTRVTSALEAKMTLLRLSDRELRTTVGSMTSSLVPSALQSVLRGRRQEISYINGEIAQLARSIGHVAATNESLTYLATRLEMPGFEFLEPEQLLDLVIREKRGFGIEVAKQGDQDR